MASLAVYDAVLDRIAPMSSGTRRWQPATGAPIPIFGPNERSERPDDASTFIDVEFPVSVSEQITVGAPAANVYREEGMFRLIIAEQRGAGAKRALELADELADLYRAKEFRGVRTFAPNPPIIDDRNDNGNYFVVAVGVPYQFDILG